MILPRDQPGYDPRQRDFFKNPLFCMVSDLTGKVVAPDQLICLHVQ